LCGIPLDTILFRYVIVDRFESLEIQFKAIFISEKSRDVTSSEHRNIEKITTSRVVVVGALWYLGSPLGYIRGVGYKGGNATS